LRNSGVGLGLAEVGYAFLILFCVVFGLLIPVFGGNFAYNIHAKSYLLFYVDGIDPFHNSHYMMSICACLNMFYI